RTAPLLPAAHLVLDDHREQRADPLQAGPALVLQDGGLPLRPLLRVAPERPDEQLLLGGEGVVQAAPRQAGRPAQVVGGGAVVAAAPEDPAGGLDHLVLVELPRPSHAGNPNTLWNDQSKTVDHRIPVRPGPPSGSPRPPLPPRPGRARSPAPPAR